MDILKNESGVDGFFFIFFFLGVGGIFLFYFLFTDIWEYGLK